MTDERPRPGPSTRAIRAASRVPDVRQVPTSVPIYQTATFASADAEELAAVLAGDEPGYAYSRIDNPTVTALGDAIADLHGAEAGIALATGMAAIHAGFLSLLHQGDRVLIGTVGYGTTRSQALAAFGRLGVEIAYVDTTDLAAVEAALAATPTRILHVETIANPTASSPTSRPSPRPPTATAAAHGRQHVRLADGLPAARARRGPGDGVRHQVPLGP